MIISIWAGPALRPPLNSLLYVTERWHMVCMARQRSWHGPESTFGSGSIFMIWVPQQSYEAVA
jgi:hypothetical protein